MEPRRSRQRHAGRRRAGTGARPEPRTRPIAHQPCFLLQASCSMAPVSCRGPCRGSSAPTGSCGPSA
eukprot:224910-Pyramimonas_sp.AAC.1